MHNGASKWCERKRFPLIFLVEVVKPVLLKLFGSYTCQNLKCELFRWGWLWWLIGILYKWQSLWPISREWFIHKLLKEKKEDSTKTDRNYQRNTQLIVRVTVHPY